MFSLSVVYREYSGGNRSRCQPSHRTDHHVPDGDPTDHRIGESDDWRRKVKNLLKQKYIVLCKGSENSYLRIMAIGIENSSELKWSRMCIKCHLDIGMVFVNCRFYVRRKFYGLRG